MKGAELSVEYYISDPHDVLYACIGNTGFGGIFRAFVNGRSPGAWEFHAPQSPEWDAIHQRIYRNHALERLDASDPPLALPELPPVPKGPFPTWRDHLLPAEPVPRAGFPRLGHALDASPGAALTAFMVLHEDTYETTHGDGEFHYLHTVHRSEEDARKYIASAAENEHTRHHLRSIGLQSSDGQIEITHFEPQLFDHVSVMEILAALEGIF